MKILHAYWVYLPHCTFHNCDIYFAVGSFYLSVFMPFTTPLAATCFFPVSLSLFIFCSICSSVKFFFFFISPIIKITQYLYFSAWLISLSIIPSRFIQVFANGKILFFNMVKYYSTAYTYHFFHIHSSVYEHFVCFLGCFQPLAIVPKDAMNMEVHKFFLFNVFYSLDEFPWLELLDQMVVLFLIFWGISMYCFP